MALNLNVRRSDFASYREYLGEQEYRLLKKVIVRLLAPHVRENSRLLDLACWDGESTEFYGQQLKITDLYGFDLFDEKIKLARKRGINVSKGDLEIDTFPYPNDHFDLIVANQIFEHLKQIYRPITEIHRVLKPGGIAIFSVPNLAALHCRIQLLCGRQPSTIKLFEAHIRGFTPRAIQPFLTFNGLFSIQAWVGSGYYPFPPFLSEHLAKIFPSTSVYQLYVLRKEKSEGKTWQDEISGRELQSNF